MSAIKDKEAATARAFRLIKTYCDVSGFSDRGVFEYAFDSVFAGNQRPRGAIGCPHGTIHEVMFSLLHPNMERQISIGTGKNGRQKYGPSKYVMDFYYSNARGEKFCIEIDGKGHRAEIKRLKDQIKEACLWLEHGIATIRFTNEEVEQLMKNRLSAIHDQSLSFEFFKQ